MLQSLARKLKTGGQYVLFFVWNSSKIYVLWLGLYYGAVHAYAYFCANPSLLGMLTAPFSAMAPHCKGLLWIINSSHEVMASMFAVFAIWASALITPPGLLKLTNNTNKTNNTNNTNNTNEERC